MSDISTLAQRAVDMNDARLEGRLSRSEHARQVAALNDEITAAGLTWDDLAKQQQAKVEHPMSLSDLIRTFRAVNRGAAIWAYPYPNIADDSDPDCDVMSKQFIEFCKERGVHAELIQVEPPKPDPWYSTHYFALIDGIAVDWTARQFYNVPADFSDWLDPHDIPCPLIFEWPGIYPLNVVKFVEAPVLTGGTK